MPIVEFCLKKEVTVHCTLLLSFYFPTILQLFNSLPESPQNSFQQIRTPLHSIEIFFQTRIFLVLEISKGAKSGDR